MAPYDHQRLFQYVEAFFAKTGRTHWPTVARAAHSLGWKQDRVEAACEGDPDGRLFLSAYNTESEQTLGEHFVESYGAEA